MIASSSSAKIALLGDIFWMVDFDKTQKVDVPLFQEERLLFSDLLVFRKQMRLKYKDFLAEGRKLA